MSRFYTEHRSAIVVAAMEEIERSIRADVQVMNSPQKVKDFLVLRLANLPFEVFGAMFLDAQNRLIETSDLFRGTLTQTSVYPREVVKEALRCNAGGAIFFHNHPSGLPEPSRADELLTRTLKDALGLVDVRVLDHIIVGGLSTTSFAERGLM